METGAEFQSLGLCAMVSGSFEVKPWWLAKIFNSLRNKWEKKYWWTEKVKVKYQPLYGKRQSTSLSLCR